MRKDARAVALRLVLYALFAASPYSITGIELATLALLPLAALELWRNPGAPRPPRRFALPFALFAAACLFSALANPTPLRNLAELVDLYRLLLPFALLPALVLVDRRRLLGALAVGAVVVGVYAAIQFQAGVDWVRPAGEKLVRPSRIAGAAVFHAQGAFSHHLTFAGFELVALAFFLALFLSDRARWRWLWLAAATASASGALFSMGRSGWVGAAIGCSLLSLRLPRRVALPLLGAGAVAGAILAASLATGRLQEALGRPDAPVLVQRLLRTSLANDVDRLYMWEAGWLGFREHPVLGIGLGNDRRDYEQYRRLVAERHGGHRYLNPPDVGVHNLYLQIAYELGLVGLAAYLGLLGSLFAWCAAGLRRAGPAHDLESGILWGTAAALAGSMAAGFFENNFFDSEVQNLLVILFGLVLHAGVAVGLGSARAAPPGGKR